MSITKPKTAEELLAVFAEMIQDFTAPVVSSEVAEIETNDDEVVVHPAVGLPRLPAGQAAPWEDVAGVMPKGVTLPMSPALYAKMLWITNNVPKMSFQKIARMGAEMAADQLIEKHYKPA